MISVNAGHLLIDDATLASVIGKKLSVFSAMQNVVDGPSATSLDVRCLVAIGGKADEGKAGQNRRS